MAAMMAELKPPPAVVERLGDVQLGLRHHALVPAGRRRAGAGDDRGDVGAVAEPVGHVGRVAAARRAGRDEVLRRDDLAGQIGVVGVDAGVDDADVHARALVAGGPGGRRADLGVAVGVQRGGPAVQPDLAQPAAELGGLLVGGDSTRGHGVRVGGTSDRGPEAAGLLLVHPYRRAVDGGQRGGRGGGRERGGGPQARLVLHDQRELAGRAVAVAVGGEVGDVEQLAVEEAGGDVRLRVGRHHVVVVAVTARLERHVLAAGGWRGGDADAALAVPAVHDRVAGDQREPGGRDGQRSLGRRGRTGGPVRMGWCGEGRRQEHRRGGRSPARPDPPPRRSAHRTLLRTSGVW
jgi:hypothetical protein